MIALCTAAAVAIAFEKSQDQELDERLLRALEAGRDAGGQRSVEGEHLTERSAVLLIHERRDDSLMDVRVDAHETAVQELRRIHTVYKPYIPYYDLRAKEPPKAPPTTVWLRQQQEQRQHSPGQS